MNLEPKFERNWLFFYLLVLVLVGLLTGYTVELIAVFLVGYIFIYLYKLEKLYQWAQSSNMENLPYENGVLGLLSSYIYQCKKQRFEQKESVKYQLERFRKLISIFPDGVVILSLSDEIQWFNNEATRLLLLEKRDIGLPINHLLRHPKVSELINRGSKGAVVTIDAPTSEDQWPVKKLEVRLLPYGDNERLLLVRDVSQMERASQMRKDFVSNASHELRTPLTVMKGYSELLLASDVIDADVRAPLKKIEQQVVKMQTMTEELLTLSRLEEGGADFKEVLVNVRSLCEQIKSELAPVADAKEQNFIVDVSPTVNLRGNKTSLVTVLRNLVTNAINYSEKAGDIHIFWSMNELGEGVLTVKDAGKGISARHLSRLTERFYRVPENNVMHKTGTGLGLAIVKHELERHDARLIIDSVVGKGSWFHCVFPITKVNITK